VEFNPPNARDSVVLVAGALDPQGITAVTPHDGYATLKAVLTRNLAVNNAPELFCFGLLETFDIPQIAALQLAGRVDHAASDNGR
jgi:hypothetical protein